MTAPVTSAAPAPAAAGSNALVMCASRSCRKSKHKKRGRARARARARLPRLRPGCPFRLERRRNDDMVAEPWVQCDGCSRWVHQICALFNGRKHMISDAEYFCPLCRRRQLMAHAAARVAAAQRAVKDMDVDVDMDGAGDGGRDGDGDGDGDTCMNTVPPESCSGAGDDDGDDDGDGREDVKMSLEKAPALEEPLPDTPKPQGSVAPVTAAASSSPTSPVSDDACSEGADVATATATAITATTAAGTGTATGTGTGTGTARQARVSAPTRPSHLAQHERGGLPSPRCGPNGQRSTDQLSSTLAHTPLSAQLEARVHSRLRACGVPHVASTISVREVSSVKLTHQVPEEMQRLLRLGAAVVSPESASVTQPHGTTVAHTYPEELPYRQRVVLLWQQIDDVDVCLFALYVQEYGTDAPAPNTRRVYIAYLDSVRYLQPLQVRTTVYHELLTAYMANARSRGYVTANIWACPPQRGDGYIFHRHPVQQRTPTKDRLRKWYDEMIAQSQAEGVVARVTSFHEQFFTKGHRMRLDTGLPPVFAGDYWATEVPRGIKDLSKLRKGKSKKSKAKNKNKNKSKKRRKKPLLKRALSPAAVSPSSAAAAGPKRKSPRLNAGMATGLVGTAAGGAAGGATTRVARVPSPSSSTSRAVVPRTSPRTSPRQRATRAQPLPLNRQQQQPPPQASLPQPPAAVQRSQSCPDMPRPRPAATTTAVVRAKDDSVAGRAAQVKNDQTRPAGAPAGAFPFETTEQRVIRLQETMGRRLFDALSEHIVIHFRPLAPEEAAQADALEAKASSTGRISCDFFDTRHGFLRMCQGNNFQVRGVGGLPGYQAVAFVGCCSVCLCVRVVCPGRSPLTHMSRVYPPSSLTPCVAPRPLLSAFCTSCTTHACPPLHTNATAATTRFEAASGTTATIATTLTCVPLVTRLPCTHTRSCWNASPSAPTTMPRRPGKP